MKLNSVLLVGLMVAGCGSDADGSGSGGSPTNQLGGGSAEGGGGSEGIAGADGTGGTVVPGADERFTITGDLTWDVFFDDAALAAGATNCSYTRTYEGVEDRSRPWLCPACEVMFRATVEMTAGLDDCYSQVSEDPPFEEEWIGYGDGVWYRGAPLTTAQGMMTLEGNAITTSNEVLDLEALAGGTMDFAIAGALTLGAEMGDPYHGFGASETYACGWPKANPPPYAGDYTIVDGGTVPDGVFLDRCGDNVRLHDFQGAYLLIGMSARDCGPCQSKASEEEAFVQAMAAQGITVHVITLLAPSLANPLGNTTQAMLTDWTETFELASPVLADTAWGLSMFIPLFGDQVGYPSWVLVDPNLAVMDSGNGFGGYADIEAAILADAN
jgi:hypothetical protein